MIITQKVIVKFFYNRCKETLQFFITLPLSIYIYYDALYFCDWRRGFLLR